MKKVLFPTLALLAALVLVAGCKPKDGTTGPVGPPGADGTDGAPGPPGPTGVPAPTLVPTATPVDTATPVPTATPTDTPVPVKRVFVTSERFFGDMFRFGTVAVDGAYLCNTSATNAGLGGTWVPWISGNGVSAKDLLSDVGPWYRLDGVLVASSEAVLTGGGGISNPINMDEFGNLVPLSLVWTGTDASGIQTSDVCNNGFITVNPAFSGTVGDTSANNFAWTAGLTFFCDNQFRIYCFEQ